MTYARHKVVSLIGLNYTLRPLAADDSSLYGSIYSDYELMRFVGEPLGLSEAGISFQSALTLTQMVPSEQFYYVLENAEQKPCGLLGARWFNQQQIYVEVGIILLKQYHGNGIAKHAVAAICNYASHYFKVDTIVARIQPDNESALYLFKQLGFSYDQQTTLHQLKIKNYNEGVYE